VKFRILGPLEVYADQPVAIRGRKQRALLTILLLHANEVVSIDRLVNDLWGETAPRTATASLQNAVSALRKILGDNVLLTRPGGYALSIDPGQLDLARFERLVADARGLPVEDRARALREALSLWRGPALAEFAYEAFAQDEIRRIEELRLATIENRIDADLDLGRHGELVGELETLVAQNPLRERLRSLLMLALYRSGRQADALNAYQEARRTLVHEVGIEPGPALQQLHASILRQDRALSSAPRAPTAGDHFEEVSKALLAGRLVPVMGADVGELADRLAERFEYPADEAHELPRVAQYIALMQGSGPLYDELHALVGAVAATHVHRFLASLPPLLRERGLPHQLAITTGYDLALEEALLDAGEQFDVVSYLAAGRHRGRFCHVSPDGAVRPIDVPNTYATELSLEHRTVVLKLHGGVDPRATREWESFVVTEDDYIDYLADSDVAAAVPVALAAKLRRSHVLFLGYGMREWNLRVVLSRLWEGGSLTYRSWAVVPAARPLEHQFWRERGVDLLEMPLEEYVDTLARYVGLPERNRT
jgi:DNA-binding SARP family transcriptional activator